MHGSTRDQLERLLSNGETAADKTDLAAHVAACPECSSELKVMRAHSAVLRSLRLPEEIEPAPGFYARVLQRIEDRAKTSIWAGFLYSPFRTRFAYASLSLALVLGLYVYAQESGDPDPHNTAVVVQQSNSTDSVFGDQNQQRNAVLVNLASYEGSSQ